MLSTIGRRTYPALLVVRTMANAKSAEAPSRSTATTCIHNEAPAEHSLRIKERIRRKRAEQEARAASVNRQMFAQRLDPLTGAVEWVVVQEQDGEGVHSSDPQQASESGSQNLDQSGGKDGNLEKWSELVVQSLYLDMLNDETRNQAYEEAIAKEVRPGELVLDIGSGTGLLSMLAARALRGSKSSPETSFPYTNPDLNPVSVTRTHALGPRVITCESFPPMARLAEKVIQENGLVEEINVVNKRSDELVVGPGKDLPKQADFLVSEILDSALLGEGLLPTLRDAWARLLRPGARTVPARARVFAQLVECEYLQRCHDLAGREAGLPDGVRLAQGLGVSGQGCLGKGPPAWAVHADAFGQLLKQLSEPFPVFDFDFANPPPGDRHVSLDLTASADGTAHGLITWWKIDLDEEGSITYSTAPKYTFPDTDVHSYRGWHHHWRQCAWPFPLGGFRVLAGARVSVEALHDDLGIWYLAGADCLGTSPSRGVGFSEDPETVGRPERSESLDTSASRERSEDLDTSASPERSEDFASSASPERSEVLDTSASLERSEDLDTSASPERSEDFKKSASPKRSENLKSSAVSDVSGCPEVAESLAVSARFGDSENVAPNCAEGSSMFSSPVDPGRPQAASDTDVRTASLSGAGESGHVAADKWSCTCGMHEKHSPERVGQLGDPLWHRTVSQALRIALANFSPDVSGHQKSDKEERSRQKCSLRASKTCSEFTGEVENDSLWLGESVEASGRRVLDACQNTDAGEGSGSRKPAIGAIAAIGAQTQATDCSEAPIVLVVDDSPLLPLLAARHLSGLPKQPRNAPDLGTFSLPSRKRAPETLQNNTPSGFSIDTGADTRPPHSLATSERIRPPDSLATTESNSGLAAQVAVGKSKEPGQSAVPQVRFLDQSGPAGVKGFVKRRTAACGIPRAFMPRQIETREGDERTVNLEGRMIAALLAEPWYSTCDSGPPWAHALRFWHRRTSLEPFLLPSASIMPHRAVLRGVAVHALELWESRRSLSSVRGFDHSAANRLLGACGLADGLEDGLADGEAQASDTDDLAEGCPVLSFPLWQCGSTYREISEPFDLLTLDFSRRMTSCEGTADVFLEGPASCHGIALWMEYDIGADDALKLSTRWTPGEGPSFSKQGIQLFRSPVEAESDGATPRRAQALRSVAKFSAKCGKITLLSQRLTS